MEHSNHVAIIGLAGRYPGARGLEELWRNLRDGVEALTTFSDDELRAAGVPEAHLRDPSLVRKRPVLDDIDLFDAALFGYTPREAEMIDPQQRIFLECAWEALETAGYSPERFDGSIGVFAGSGFLSYFLANLLQNKEYLRSVGWFQAMLGNDKDFMAQRVSYKLNLRGPSINVLTSCSSSLVGVHLACQSLLNHESDLALAGGATVMVPQRGGYRYQPGSVNSPDGHSRAFDAGANGTIPGEGAAVVVLKRLDKALEDRDRIYGVIRGSAVNNDGASKAGFTAPSVQGQAAVVAEALAIGDVAPETVTYVEAHGTGTPVGDAIEIAALTTAFNTSKRGYCAVGTIKPNIGHTDTPAGVMGLIKVLLAFEHGQLPPLPNLQRPNPNIDWGNSPFYPLGRLQDWRANGAPRRAGVSSFSLGGTNAHVVVEEPPTPPPPAPSRPSKLVVLSAASDAALEVMSKNLAGHLAAHRDLDIADVAHTLQVGRNVLRCRKTFVCQDIAGAIEALSGADNRRVFVSRAARGSEAAVVFLFPGQGSQYVGMAEDLYAHEPGFRETIDTCAKLLLPEMRLDLRSVLYPQRFPGQAYGPDLIHETWVTQPALFVTEYAIARLLQDWNVVPQAMIGHSVGEFVAACLSGVMSLQDALQLIALRGRLIHAQPRGAMAAVALSSEAIAPHLTSDLSLAAVNGPTQVAVAGAIESIEALLTTLKSAGVACKRLAGSHAFHSHLIEPVVDQFTAQVARRSLHAPSIPFISNVTGTWITAAEATNPRYWGRQLREPVRFFDGLGRVRADHASTNSRLISLEVGPGDTLRGLLAMQGADMKVMTTLPRLQHGSDQGATLLEAIGRLWSESIDIKWEAFSQHEHRRRTPLPTYPFERKRYWVLPSSLARDPVPTEVPPEASEPAHSEPAPRSQHDRPDLPSAYVAPRTPTEQTLVSIWQEITGVAVVGVHDNFFDLGGHSLLAAQIVSRVHKAYPVRITVAELLQDTPTVAGMAEGIDRKVERDTPEDSDDVPLVRVPRS